MPHSTFPAVSHAFADADVLRARAFTTQASTALTIMVRHARHAVLRLRAATARPAPCLELLSKMTDIRPRRPDH
jgi:hypothetical protein